MNHLLSKVQPAGGKLPSSFEPFLKAFESVDDVIEKLEWFEGYCLKSGDLRGVFATAYLQVTRSLINHLSGGTFRDERWVRTYLVRFGNLYREAVIDYEAGRNQQVPKSWKISFETAANKEGLVIQHLLLGINAHINHDLAVALYDVKINPDREDKYYDHTKVNEVLEQTTEALKREVTDKYAPILRRLDRKTGNVSDDITNFSIPKAREHAWSFAIALTRSVTDGERKILRSALNEQAAVLARLILASPTRNLRFKRSVAFLKWVDGSISRIRSRLFRLK
jgi:hypothetical protein